MERLSLHFAHNQLVEQLDNQLPVLSPKLNPMDSAIEDLTTGLAALEISLPNQRVNTESPTLQEHDPIDEAVTTTLDIITIESSEDQDLVPFAGTEYTPNSVGAAYTSSSSIGLEGDRPTGSTNSPPSVETTPPPTAPLTLDSESDSGIRPLSPTPPPSKVKHPLACKCMMCVVRAQQQKAQRTKLRYEANSAVSRNIWRNGKTSVSCFMAGSSG